MKRLFLISSIKHGFRPRFGCRRISRTIDSELNSVQDPGVGIVGGSGDAAEVFDYCDGEYDDLANCDAQDNGNPSSSPAHTDMTSNTDHCVSVENMDSTA